MTNNSRAAFDDWKKVYENYCGETLHDPWECYDSWQACNNRWEAMLDGDEVVDCIARSLFEVSNPDSDWGDVERYDFQVAIPAGSPQMRYPWHEAAKAAIEAIKSVVMGV